MFSTSSQAANPRVGFKSRVRVSVLVPGSWTVFRRSAVRGQTGVSRQPFAAVTAVRGGGGRNVHRSSDLEVTSKDYL